MAMRHRIWSIIPVAVLTALALYLFVNMTVRLNGQGLLSRQAWPINSPGMWGIAGAVVGAIRTISLLRHLRSAREQATQQGRSYLEECVLPPGSQGLPVFRGWQYGINAMGSKPDEPTIYLFDYFADPPRKGGHPFKRTIALVPIAGLPEFEVGPRTFMWRLMARAGVRGIVIDADTAGAHAYEVEQFSDCFYLIAGHLLGNDSKGPRLVPIGDETEDAIHRVFTARLIRELNRLPGYSTQSGSGFLAVWRGDGLLDEQGRSELWDAAGRLRAAIVADG